MSSGEVLFERVAQHVALVTINRPHVRNAISGDVAEVLESIVLQTENDDTVRAVVLTGAGGNIFSAGADLHEVAAGGLSRIIRPETGFGGFVHAVRSKPWIAAAEGPALAGGCELALACELIVTTYAGAFGLPNVARGLTAWAGGVYRLPRRLPRAIALRAILTAELLDAETAARYGLVNEVVPQGQAVARALALADKIASNAPFAVRESLAIARLADDLDDDTLRSLSDESRARIIQSDDFAEGVRAFIEKRAPLWTGH